VSHTIEGYYLVPADAEQGGCPPGMRCEYNSNGVIVRVESIDESWRTKANVELAKGIGEGVAIAAAGELAGAYIGSMRLFGWAAAKFFASRGGIAVIGRNPAYLELAGELGAERFSIPPNVWSKMTSAEQWAANVKFLDDAVARGDQFVLSNSAKLAKQGTAFWKELQYLYSKGYKAASDGMSLIAPK
jgi:hypothetical protein